jgi:hypothetical protein
MEITAERAHFSAVSADMVATREGSALVGFPHPHSGTSGAGVPRATKRTASTPPLVDAKKSVKS